MWPTALYTRHHLSCAIPAGQTVDVLAVAATFCLLLLIVAGLVVPLRALFSCKVPRPPQPRPFRRHRTYSNSQPTPTATPKSPTLIIRVQLLVQLRPRLDANAVVSRSEYHTDSYAKACAAVPLAVLTVRQILFYIVCERVQVLAARKNKTRQFLLAVFIELLICD